MQRSILTMIVVGVVVGIGSLAFAADATNRHRTLPGQNSSFYDDNATFLQFEDADRLRDTGAGGFVVSGGTHAPVVGMASAAFATRGYTMDGLYVAQSVAAINYMAQGCATDDTAWVILDSGVTGHLADFVRVTGTHYLVDCSSVTQPSLPSTGAWLMRVTLTGGAIVAVSDLRVPLSYIRHRVYDVTDPLYGGVGNGVADDTVPLESTLAAAPTGAVVYIPAGTYLVTRNLWVTRGQMTIQGGGYGSIIRAAPGFVNTANKGMLTFGYSPATGITSVSDVVVRDLTLNGNSLAKAAEFLSVTRGTLSHVHASLGGPTHAVIATETTTDLLVEECIVAGASGQFGDGIYVGGGIRPKIVLNTITDVTRLGIVTEQDGSGTNSKDVLIEGNRVSYAHHATGAEHNGGIWLENTDGGQVLGNTVENLYNTPGAQLTSGITLQAGGASGSQFQVVGNSVSGAQIGLWVAVGSGSNVQASQLSVKRGAISNYVAGVYVQSGFNVDLSGIQLGANAYQAGGHGGILVSLLAEMNSLSVVDSSVAGPSAMVYSDSAAADFNIFTLGGFVLSNVTLRNLQNWKVQMRGFPTTVVVTESNLKYDSDAYPIFGATATLRVANSAIGKTSGSGTVFVTPRPGATYTFTQVQFVDVIAALTQADGGGLQYLYLFGCATYNTSWTMTGYFYLSMDGTYWNQYPAGGALLGNGSNTMMHLRIRNSDFNHASDVPPLNVTNFNPTTLVVMNVVRSSTSLGTMVPTSPGYVQVDILP